MTDRLIGKQLGGYRVRDLLGSGGMARVYRGYDPSLDREVAIKVISVEGQPPDFVDRFRREARVVAKLNHPHIVHVYHYGEQDDVVYMVQQLLPGPTLDMRLREGGRRRVPADQVQSVIAQVADALDFAHAQGVIHRDVKPGNMLYDGQGQIVLTDFGIARSLSDVRTTATGPGVVMGTPAYVAPEQAISSASLTPACDVYSLGVVLFQMLTGRLPFDADTPMGVVLKHLYDEPPAPSGLRVDLPPTVDAVVLRALRKEPEARYASAGALADALRDAWPARTAKSAPAKAVPAAAAAPARKPRAAASDAPATPASKRATADAPATPAPKRASSDIPAPVAAVRRAPSETRNATPKPAARPASTVTPKPTPAARKTPIVAAEPPADPAPAPQPRRSRWLLLLLLVLIIGGVVLVMPYLQNDPVIGPQIQQIQQMIGPTLRWVQDSLWSLISQIRQMIGV
ncbi:MAG TPA: protein kinase [Roseiflexaceae bacterium]|nr:protein kinase [Roseiflexaceae bacterium]